MKGFIIGVVTSIALVSTASNAGLLSSITTSDWPVVDTQQYLIKAKGFDVRGYTWSPLENKEIVCTAAFTDSGGAGVSCVVLK